MENSNKEVLDILLIEDNPDHAYFIRRALAEDRFRVTHLTDGKEALDCLLQSNQRFHVVILDYHLPSMDGLEVIKKVREEKKDYAFIFLTVDNTVDTAVEAMKTGAMDFMPKTHQFYNGLPAMIEKVHELHQAGLEKKRIEEKLKESEEKYREIFNNVNDAIYMHGITEDGMPGKFLEVNELACRQLGYTRREYLLMTPKDFTPPELFNLSDVMDRLLRTGHCTFEMVHITKDGGRIPVEISAHLFHHGKNKEKRILSLVRDITERKKTEEQLKKSLKEKELLLREIHHRVKNNLSIIHSLLHFQERLVSASGQSVEALLKNTRNRIKSMALVHDKLYKARDFTRIHFSEYCNDLVSHLVQSFQHLGSSGITFKIEADNIHLDIDTIIPCGLIINELVTNALKHAFPGDKYEKEPEIRVILHCVENNHRCRLTISDNGKGLPADFDRDRTDSLGMFIVHALVDQLEGTLEIDQTGGTTFIICFSPRKT